MTVMNGPTVKTWRTNSRVPVEKVIEVLVFLACGPMADSVTVR